jgi:hypothetical protein
MASAKCETRVPANQMTPAKAVKIARFAVHDGSGVKVKFPPFARLLI